MSFIINLFSRRSRKDRFEVLLRPHIEVLYRMAYRWTQSQDRAEDLVQDVLIKVASRVDEMEQLDNLKSWLLRIMYNRYVDDYRRQRASPIDTRHSGWSPESDNDDEPVSDFINDAVDPVQPIAQQELRLSLHKALAQLDPEQRELVLLQDLEGYSAEEAAAIMGIPIGTAKSRLHRARERLKQLLFEAGDDG